MSFTKGPAPNLTYEQVEHFAAQLSDDEQIKLAKKLEKDLARRKLLMLMDEIRPKKPVSEAEILKISKQVRKRVAARYSRDAAARRR